MDKPWSVTLLGTIALLGCLAGIGVKAQVHTIKRPPPPNQNPWIPSATREPWMPPHPDTDLTLSNPHYIIYQGANLPSAPRPAHQIVPILRIPTPSPPRNMPYTNSGGHSPQSPTGHQQSHGTGGYSPQSPPVHRQQTGTGGYSSQSPTGHQQSHGTGGHSPQSPTGHQQSHGTSGYSPQSPPGHRQQTGTGGYSSQSPTGHRQQTGTGGYSSQSPTGHRQQTGTGGYSSQSPTGHQQSHGTGGYSPQSPPGHRQQTGTGGYSSQSPTGHQQSHGTGGYSSQSPTGHQQSHGTGGYSSQSPTGHRQQTGTGGHSAHSPPGHRRQHSGTGGHSNQGPTGHQQPQPGTPSYQNSQSYIPRPEKNCDVDRNVRVSCGSPSCGAAECDAIGCCHDGNQCFYGKAVTVQCTKDGQFIVVAAKDATVPHLDTDTITLMEEGQGCAPVDSNSLFSIYQFPVTTCGTMVMENHGCIIYQNRLTSSFEVIYGVNGAITRDSQYEVLFQCKYIGHSVEALVEEVVQYDHLVEPAVALGPVNIQMRLGNGQCTVKGCDEVSVAYNSYFTEFDYPVTKILREPVYVEVQILDRADPMLVLTLDRCWTTTSPSPHSMPQWDILVHGCPYSDDRYMTSMIAVPSDLEYPSHYKRFSFKMFTFVDQISTEPQQQHVYIHCSTALCTPYIDTACEPTCNRKGKRNAPAIEQRKTKAKSVVSSKLVIVTA